MSRVKGKLRSKQKRVIPRQREAREKEPTRRWSPQECARAKSNQSHPQRRGLILPSHLIFVQPNVCQPQGVVCHGVLAFGGTVGSSFPENVSNSGARDDEELTPTHPDLVRSKACVNSCLTVL